MDWEFGEGGFIELESQKIDGKAERERDAMTSTATRLAPLYTDQSRFPDKRKRSGTVRRRSERIERP